MYNEILSLEKKFFSYNYISDKNWLEQILHDDFIECGESGLLSDKQDTVMSLLQCKQDRKISIYNYDCCQIDRKSWIVHYVTLSAENKKYFRMSIWVDQDGLRLYYHQATLLNMEIKRLKEI